MKMNFLKRPEQEQPPEDLAKDSLSEVLNIKRSESDRSQDEFLSIASHELRTPLTTIKGNTSMIRQYFWDQLPSDEVRQMVKDIGQASDRMLKLVNYFLDTLRLEQKLVKFEQKQFDIVPLISSVVHAHQENVKHNVHLMFKGSESHIPQIIADKKWVSHALENLLDNALKFTEHGNVTVSLTQETGFVKVIIADTGHGIPREAQKLIFNKFAQTNEDILTRDTLQGAGLGLYMTRLIMDQMHGSVHLEYSEPAIGSTFSISLPAAHS
jgi:signal transduction histidine kinase